MKAVYDLFEKTIRVLSGAALALVFVLCLIFQVYITLDFDERPVYYRNGIFFWLALVAAAVILAAGMKYLRRVRPGRLFLLCATLYAAAGLYLIFRADASVRGDAGMIYKYLEPFLAGDYTGLTKGRYLRWYPYQLGMLTWEMLFSSISKSPRLFFTVNLACSTGIHFFQWKITKLLLRGEEDPARENCAILLSFLFAPQFFFILFLYGQIPGLFFLEAGALCVLYALQSRAGETRSAKRIAAGTAGCLFTGTAVLLKQNYRIGALALAIVCLLQFLRGGRRLPEGGHDAQTSQDHGAAQNPGAARLRTGAIILCAGLLLAPPVMQEGLYAYYRNASGIDFGHGAPMSTVIAMGLMESEGSREDGWYNGFEYDTFEAVDFDEDAAAAIGRKKIAERLSDMRGDPARAARFFGRKIVSTWCDPLFGSVWSGPLPAADQQTYSAILQNIYRGGRAYELIEDWMNIEVLLILLGALLMVLSGLRQGSVFPRENPLPQGNSLPQGRSAAQPFSLYPALYFLGGFLFHLASETKSQYVYMYVYCLIPLCAAVFADVSGKASGSYPGRNTRSSVTDVQCADAQIASAADNRQEA